MAKGCPEELTGRGTRPYRTAIRRGDAPEKILQAAAELFASNGYGATSIMDIAAAASVARPTVFAAVGTKPVIFRAVLEAAVAGDGPTAPALDLPWVRQVLDEPDARRMLHRHAHAIRLVGERISDLYWAAECAAETDPEVREVFRAIDDDRLAVGRAVAEVLARRARLRNGYDATGVAEVLNAVVSPAVWRALVRDSGWSPDRWEAWAGESTCRILLAEGD